MNVPAVTYQIDGQGRILSVGPEWERFAHANHGAHLTGSTVRGRVLWDFISDPTTRALYRALVERLIAGVPEIRFTFRCDAPGERRLLEMQMRPLAEDRIEFQVTPVKGVDRPAIPLLDPTVARNGELLRMCSWCKRVPAGEAGWIDVEVAVQRIGWPQLQQIPAITHGICPTCEAQVFGIIDGAGAPAEPPVTFGAFG